MKRERNNKGRERGKERKRKTVDTYNLDIIASQERHWVTLGVAGSQNVAVINVVSRIGGRFGLAVYDSLFLSCCRTEKTFRTAR